MKDSLQNVRNGRLSPSKFLFFHTNCLNFFLNGAYYRSVADDEQSPKFGG